MKRVMKQPCFWIAFFSFLLAAGIAVGSSLMNPKIAVMEKFERGVNKRKTDTIISCFTPEVQLEIKAWSALSGADFGEAFAGAAELGKLNVVYGDAVEDEDGDLSVRAFMIYNQGGKCVDVDYEELDVEEIDGKVFLTYY